ncbi:MAG: MFS transporter [Lawsonibacter sp.]|nr:MFS transporter [Lawsonibacter sp.]
MKTKQSGSLRPFLILWSTQSLSTMGSSMTAFALVLWSYQAHGSALTTALLSVCSYAPYVAMSIFAGALSDRWDKKRTMLVCDTFAALCTLVVLGLAEADVLELGHLYLVNALSGLMNTVQQPAADVAVTLLTPREHFQRAGGLRSLSYSLNNMLSPVLAAGLYAFAGLRGVILFDLATFCVAFLSLLLLIRLPQSPGQNQSEPVLQSARTGLNYLRRERGVLDIILFLAAINLTASMFNAALPALALTRPWGGETALGLVQSASGTAMLAGSLVVSLLPAPKSRVRTICNCLLLAMSTENFCLALGKDLPVWCAGAALGWVGIPVMNANLDALLRDRVPVELQGRVYAARNTLQFFTIPVGYLLGGFLTDRVFEPLAARMEPGSLWDRLFGLGKGSGTAGLFLVLGFLGVLTCLIFRRDRHIWNLEEQP